jgi:hypothetical protein
LVSGAESMPSILCARRATTTFRLLLLVISHFV